MAVSSESARPPLVQRTRPFPIPPPTESPYYTLSAVPPGVWAPRLPSGPPHRWRFLRPAALELARPGYHAAAAAAAAGRVGIGEAALSAYADPPTGAPRDWLEAVLRDAPSGPLSRSTSSRGAPSRTAIMPPFANTTEATEATETMEGMEGMEGMETERERERLPPLHASTVRATVTDAAQRLRVTLLTNAFQQMVDDVIDAHAYEAAGREAVRRHAGIFRELPLQSRYNEMHPMTRLRLAGQGGTPFPGKETQTRKTGKTRRSTMGVAANTNAAVGGKSDTDSTHTNKKGGAMPMSRNTYI